MVGLEVLKGLFQPNNSMILWCRPGASQHQAVPPQQPPFLAFAMHAGSGCNQNWCWSGLADIVIASKFLEMKRALEFPG